MNGDPTPLKFGNVDAEFYGVDLEDDFYRIPPLYGRVSVALLLAAHYDAAFDKGLISFDEDGRMLMKADLSTSLANLLRSEKSLSGLTAKHVRNLAWHRAYFDFNEGA